MASVGHFRNWRWRSNSKPTKRAAGNTKSFVELTKLLISRRASTTEKPSDRLLGGEDDDRLLADMLQQYGKQPPKPEPDDEPE